VKLTGDNSNKKTGFTIIELLTVMSIIIILISLLAPALNRVKRYATEVKQKAQLHSLAVALDLFNAEFEGYPDSSRLDTAAPTPQEYCGAMKLAEAMVGQDLKGFNPNSRFRQDGMDSDVAPITNLYPPENSPTPADYAENIKSRKMYLELERANAYQMKDIYDAAAITTAKFNASTFVLCDAYNRVTNKTTGKKMGMPILYYKADLAKSAYPDSNVPSATIQTNALSGMYIYNFNDNQQLIDMGGTGGIPWAPLFVHPLATSGLTPEGETIDPTIHPKRFYDIVRDKKIATGDRPYRADSYILISAGFDGEYGTKDDIYNFGD
jgi:type II secretory pathway pseudopilin PulG